MRDKVTGRYGYNHSATQQQVCNAMQYWEWLLLDGKVNGNKSRFQQARISSLSNGREQDGATLATAKDKL